MPLGAFEVALVEIATRDDTGANLSRHEATFLECASDKSRARKVAPIKANRLEMAIT
jgi:hypothetical protein